MGMPVVTAPCEAEAQCAELAAGGVVWGVASEDMDTLTFAAPNLVRRITASASRNQAPLHFNLAEALKGLGLTQAQFVDMCILCGSDYTKKTIAGVGPKTAHKLVKSEGSMEGVLAKVAADKLPAPEDFNWREARELFLHHEVLPHTEVEAKWGDADEQGVVDFLVGEKGFNEDRVRSALKRLKKARKVGNQKRMDSFFGGGAKKDPFAAAAASKPLKSTAATSEPLKSTAAAAAAAPAAAGAGGSATGGRGTKRRITSTSSQSRKK
ncbi:FEN1 [Symbiodinium sp. KB8]|nr:FEN1 [Symbiodinium sp. KB8]